MKKINTFRYESISRRSLRGYRRIFGRGPYRGSGSLGARHIVRWRRYCGYLIFWLIMPSR
jgi:hypothetical protein